MYIVKEYGYPDKMMNHGHKAFGPNPELVMIHASGDDTELKNYLKKLLKENRTKQKALMKGIVRSIHETKQIEAEILFVMGWSS